MTAARRLLPLVGLLLLAGCSSRLRPRPESIDFGPVWIGQTASVPKPIRWRNGGRNPKHVTGATITGDPAFTFAGGAPSGTIAPDESGAPTVVVFAPVAGGEVRATIQPAGARSEPLQVMGTGAAQRRRGMLELTADGMTPGKPLEMGTVELNRIGVTGVYLANRAREPMKLNVRLVSGRAVRVLGPTFPLLLEPGRRVRVNLEFCPGTLGRIADAIEAESTDGRHFAGTALVGTAIR